MPSILLVEDDRALRNLMKTILKTAGYRVLEAGDGASALDQLPAMDSDDGLIVLDLGLPDFDGSTFLAEAQHRGFDGKVLIVSGSFEGREVAKMIGAEGFLPKPFSPEKLEETVRQLLAQ